MANVRCRQQFGRIFVERGAPFLNDILRMARIRIPDSYERGARGRRIGDSNDCYEHYTPLFRYRCRYIDRYGLLHWLLNWLPGY